MAGLQLPDYLKGKSTEEIQVMAEEAKKNQEEKAGEE